MSSIQEVSQAVVERLEPVLPSDWELKWYTPLSPPCPSLCLRPDDNKFADFQVTVGGYTKWFLRAGLTVLAEEEEAAYSWMGDLVARGGPIHTALRDDTLRDSLWALCGLNVAVTDGRKWRVNRNRRLMADIGIELGSN